MVLSYVRQSWQNYRENWMNFVTAEIIALGITGIIALIGVMIILSSAELSALILLSPREFISRIVSVLSLFEGMAKASIFFIISGVAWTFFKTGLYGMAAQALRGRVNYNTMFNVAKRKGLTGLFATILTGFICLLLLVVLVVSFGFIFFGGVLVGIILFLFTVILFSLVFPGIVVDQLDVVESIVNSVKIVNKNYFEMLCLLLFYTGLSFLVSLIPLIGPVILVFILAPMTWMSLIMFYKKRKY